MSKRTTEGMRGMSSTNSDAPSAVVSLVVDRDALRSLVTEILSAQPNVDWPSERLALTEEEAAAACGVGRHVLRDMRLNNQLPTRTLGRRVVYTRSDLLAALDAHAAATAEGRS